MPSFDKTPDNRTKARRSHHASRAFLRTNFFTSVSEISSFYGNELKGCTIKTINNNHVCMVVPKKIAIIIIVLMLLIFVGIFIRLARHSTPVSSDTFSSFSSLFFQEPEKQQSPVVSPVTPPLTVEEIYSIVPISGEVVDQFGTAQCAVSDVTIPCSTIQLTTGARVNSTDATAPTHAPAWLVMQVQTDQPINTLRFNWRFTAGGEGLLRVFVKGNPDREIDQRHVPAVSSEPESIYLDELGPGTYKIAFRLDGYGANPSSVELTGIELGWKTLKASR